MSDHHHGSAALPKVVSLMGMVRNSKILGNGAAVVSSSPSRWLRYRGSKEMKCHDVSCYLIPSVPVSFIYYKRQEKNLPPA
jgi:hypothetical protein